MTVKRMEGYLKLGAHSVYSFDPVATYLKMPWKYHLPTLSLKSEKVQAAFYLLGEAAPFILSRTKSYALMSITRLGSQACRLYYEETGTWEKVKIGLDMFSTLSPILLTFSGIAPGYFIAAQVAKIGMEIFEIRGELNTWDGYLTLMSHSFYLIALTRSSSYQVRLASMVFQGVVSGCQMVKNLGEEKNILGVTWGFIGALRFHEAYQYHQFQTAAKIRFVYKQRHGEKEKTPHPPLTQRGYENAKLAGPIVEKYLLEKTGISRWAYASSTYLRSYQTVQAMLQGLGRPDQEHFRDTRLGERMRGETSHYRYLRHEAAVDDLLDIVDLDQGIFTADHSIAGRDYASGVDITHLPTTKKGLKYLEGFLFKRANHQTELLDRFLPQTTTSTS